MTWKAVLASAAFALLPAAAQGQAMTGEGSPIVPSATEADYARTVETTVTAYIVPAYERLEHAAAALGPTVSALCAVPSAQHRSAVASAFAATVRAWAAVDFMRFGPMARENRYERFAFFPDVHGTGARQLRRFLASQDQALLAPGAIARQSAAVQGLPALESLLYAGSKALAEADAMDAYRCGLAEAISANLKQLAAEALAGWQGEGSWTALLENPGADNPVYRTHAEAMTEILKAILTGLEQVREHRLLPALGDTPDSAKASRAPYNASGQALPYLAASAAALRDFVDASGILALPPASQAAYARSATFEFANLERALAAAGPDLDAALADPQLRSKLVYATIVLASLRDIFQRHIAVWAGLTPGFNSLDGD